MAKKTKKNEIVEPPIIEEEDFTCNIKLKCKTPKQKELVKAISGNDITFCKGMFGVGKTYVINSVALQMLFNPNKKIKKIILIVPTPANSPMTLGLLPGTLNEKLEAFQMNEIDAFIKIFDNNGYDGEAMIRELFKRHMLETRPITYLRGASIEDSFICVSEAEEFTKEEMFLIMSRFQSGKMVISGDPIQAFKKELKKNSGLNHAFNVLEDTKGIGLVEFEKNDIVRNDIVRDIFDKWHEIEEIKNKEESY